eukprot:TRINITY_DN34815_c0_g1_i1.p1 TRINITY_DN34815_c0_g1~~TRINITY_DN34815_c0_g1_i1.p1  ORF type:complete len:354 (+),score=59.93 TRINITY_DN34815_c0_g1_i1:120-1181(+)
MSPVSSILAVFFLFCIASNALRHGTGTHASACARHVSQLTTSGGSYIGNSNSIIPVGLDLMYGDHGQDNVDSPATLAAMEQERLWCVGTRLAQLASRAVDENRRNVLWLHMHNYGGTMMCQEAARQGERTPPANCNWENCSQQTRLVSCAHKARSARFSFSMLERELQPSDLCQPDVLYGTMLRDPIMAMESTMRDNNFDMSRIVEILTTGNTNLTESHTGCLPAWDSYEHFDNFATRSLSGAYMLPPRGVTRDHLEAAKQRLRNMDVLLILEELRQHTVQLSVTLGWDLSLMHPEKHVQAIGFEHPRTHFDDDVREFLQSVNALDYELYAFGRRLAAEKSADANVSATFDAM